MTVRARPPILHVAFSSLQLLRMRGLEKSLLILSRHYSMGDGGVGDDVFSSTPPTEGKSHAPSFQVLPSKGNGWGVNLVTFKRQIVNRGTTSGYGKWDSLRNHGAFSRHCFHDEKISFRWIYVTAIVRGI